MVSLGWVAGYKDLTLIMRVNTRLSFQENPDCLCWLFVGYHSVGHLGKNSILARYRCKFWIVGANQVIKRLVSACVTCRRYHAKATTQMMVDLPVDRIVSGETPFSGVEIDYFGPFHVKRGRISVKRYGVVFTCLATRAIHLEIAFSLDTISCVNSISRFLSRRGTLNVMWSDNGTNLVGAGRELREQIQAWNDTLLQREIEWHFNPPSASHFGGIWERMIRTIRKVIHGVLHEQVYYLDDEGLNTLFCEAENIVNSRPITKMNDTQMTCLPSLQITFCYNNQV